MLARLPFAYVQAVKGERNLQIKLKFPQLLPIKFGQTFLNRTGLNDTAQASGVHAKGMTFAA